MLQTTNTTIIPNTTHCLEFPSSGIRKEMVLLKIGFLAKASLDHVGLSVPD
jgi:hypothetical protein